MAQAAPLIGVFARGADSQARRLERALNAFCPGSAAFCDLSLNEPECSSLGDRTATWNGLDLTSLKIAFLRGFTYCDPVIPSGDLDVDWSVWRFDYIAERQKYTYLHSLFCELERRGVAVINSPNAQMRSFMKPFVQESLRKAGLKVPALVCTNTLDVVRDFCARMPKVVWRPATGRAAWQLFTDRQRDALISPQKPPVLLAELADGPLVRAYLFKGEPLLMLERHAPDCENEERLEEFWETSFPTVLPDLRRAMDGLQMPWGEATFAVKDGQPWLYDADADPRDDGLPTVHQEKLTALLAARLLEACGVRVAQSASPASLKDGESEAFQRQTLFLRRMLRILFEFEHSKYAKPEQK